MTGDELSEVKDKFVSWNELRHENIFKYIEEYGGSPPNEDPNHMYIIAEYEDLAGDIS
jgi:hypothetical protein